MSSTSAGTPFRRLKRGIITTWLYCSTAHNELAERSRDDGHGKYFAVCVAGPCLLVDAYIVDRVPVAAILSLNKQVKILQNHTKKTMYLLYNSSTTYMFQASIIPVMEPHVDTIWTCTSNCYIMYHINVCVYLYCVCLRTRAMMKKGA